MSSPLPSDWPQLSTALYYDDAAKAIDWLCTTFGFKVRIKVEGEDGKIRHSELDFEGALVMVAQAGREQGRSPASLGGANTQSILIYVTDVDAHCERTRAAGGKINSEPTTTDHGAEYWSDRTYEAEDLEGHRWWFSERVRAVKQPG
jgi:uncharacterized glyoxalase superfamily protein PhnB